MFLVGAIRFKDVHFVRRVIPLTSTSMVTEIGITIDQPFFLEQQGQFKDVYFYC